MPDMQQITTKSGAKLMAHFLAHYSTKKEDRGRFMKLMFAGDTLFMVDDETNEELERYCVASNIWEMLEKNS